MADARPWWAMSAAQPVMHSYRCIVCGWRRDVPAGSPRREQLLAEMALEEHAVKCLGPSEGHGGGLS